MDTEQTSNPDEKPSPKDLIVQTLRQKSIVKQKVYDITFEAFTRLKEVLHELSNEINDDLSGLDKRVKLDYRDRGKFEAEVKVAEDTLIFSMHSNIFEFDREHMIWKTSYIKADPNNSFCGIISVYNFLADSFKYNRMDDVGYLITRIFVNHQKHFFVEGKRQMGFMNDFGSQELTNDKIRNILCTSIQYAIDFDLLVPPYDNVKLASVEQVVTKIENAKLQTGKRLGFQYNTDDIAPV